MDRYECNSRLRITPSLGNRALQTRLRHKNHTPYDFIQIGPEALTFMNERVTFQKTSKIWQNLYVSGLAKNPANCASSGVLQVDTGEQRFLEKSWWPFLASNVYASRTRDKYHHYVILVASIRALAIYICSSIDALSRNTKEAAIDSAFGINKAGNELYALLAEFDGTRVSMAYLFVEKVPSNGTAPNETTTQVLDRSLRPLQQSSMNPSSADCDEDRSEIKPAQ